MYTVRNTHLSRIGQGLASDFGAVYLAPYDLSCWRANRTCAMPALVSGNVIHGTRHLEYGANGVYLDAAASAVTVERNLVFDTGGPAIYAHCGVANTVRSNIFVETNVQDGRAPFQGCDESGVGDFVTGQASATQNVMAVLLRKPAADGHAIRGAGVAVAAIAGGTPSTAAWRKHANTTTFDRNLYAPADLAFPPGVGFTEWQANNQDRHSLLRNIAQVSFMNASARDFRLQSSCVARVQLGVEEPLYVDVGPRQTAALLRLQPPTWVFARYPFW